MTYCFLDFLLKRLKLLAFFLGMQSFWHPCLIWMLQFMSRNPWRLTKLTDFNRCTKFLLRMQRYTLSLTGFRGHQVMVRGNGVEISAGGRDEGERGPWQLSRSNKRLPLWTDTRRRGVGGEASLTTQLPQTCHSGCYRASSSGLDNGASGQGGHQPDICSDSCINCLHPHFDLSFLTVKLRQF